MTILALKQCQFVALSSSRVETLPKNWKECEALRHAPNYQSKYDAIVSIEYHFWINVKKYRNHQHWVDQKRWQLKRNLKREKYWFKNNLFQCTFWQYIKNIIIPIQITTIDLVAKGRFLKFEAENIFEIFVCFGK